MPVALSLMGNMKRVMSGMKNFLHPFKGFVLNNTQLRAFYYHPLCFVLFFPLAGQKISDLLLPIDDLPGIQLIGQDSCGSILTPLTIPLRFQPSSVYQ